MSNKSMGINELNEIMKLCSDTCAIRYISFTIHPRAKYVVDVTIHTEQESKVLNITNNPDPNFNLYDEVVKYIESLKESIL
ncbi:hypothetical protein [Robertmurraya siralis]|uniref:hypothetical protein n=1 Tax=Robertmurraya siralis TaxID=77777 RepID=UPI0010F6B0FB|nr:hypothetical protein [Robertmurraya siralis]